MLKPLAYAIAVLRPSKESSSMDQRTASSRPHRAQPALFVIASVLGIGLLLAACSGGGASPSAAASSSAASAGASASGGSAGNTVTLQNIAFSPATLTVTAGTTVTFKNLDTVGHTATNGVNGVADANALFDLDLPAGTAGTFKFDKPGTYQVTCKIHHGMHMTIVVQ
jgi:plastocyanin